MNEDGFASGYMCGRDSNGNNGNGAWGDGGWIWFIVILLIFGWGNGGWGNGNNGGGQSMMTGYDFGKLATTNDVASGFATSAEMGAINDIKLGQTDIQQTLCQGFNGVNTALLQASNATDREIAQIGCQLQQCCCDTQRQIDGVNRSIDGVNYNMAKNTCDIQNTINGSTRDIIDGQRDSTNAILNFLTTEKISSLQLQNAALTNQLSQFNQTNNIINALRPVPQPAYITCSPFQSVYGYNPYGYSGNSNGGCGCGV